MGYRWMGGAHAWLLRLGSERGQGTVEYVGLILLLAAVLTAVVTVGGAKGGDIGSTIIEKLKDTIDSVGAKK